MHQTAITIRKAHNLTATSVETYEKWVLAKLYKYIEYYTQKVGNDDKPTINKRVLDIPSRLGFSYYIGTTRGKITRLGIKFPGTIGYQLERVDDLKNLILIDGGLSKKYNSAIVIFLLKTQHGYMDQSKRASLQLLRDKNGIDANSILKEVHELSDAELEARIAEIKQTPLTSV